MSDNLTIPSPIGYRPPRRQKVMLTPEMLRKLLIAGGLLGVLVVAVVIGTWVGRSTGDIPIILPDDRPIRVKPDDPGGLKVSGIDNGLFGDGDTQGDARLAAAPEAPNPLALRAPPEAQPQPANDATTGTTATPAPPPIRPQPAAPPKPQTPTASPRTAATGQTPTTTAPRTTEPGPARTVTQEAPRSAVPAPAPTAAKPEPKPATGRLSVQLAAVQSEGAAQAEWQALRLRHPDLFGARQVTISKIERDGRTFWRVRTGGFADLAEARGFCDRARAKGAACTVAEF